MAVRLARLLFALAISSLPTQSDQTRTIMAINAGGDTTIAADGEVYERDRYYQGGVVSKKGKDLVINGTNSPALYQTERFAIGEELWYSLPIPFNVGHNGRGWTFVLTLKFVEVQFNATGRRMFGVNLNGLHVLRDIDVFSMVGWGTAYDEQIEFRIDPDHYAIWVTSVGPMRVRIEQPAAFYGDLHVALTPTEFGNARLCAMQLTQGTLEELDAAAEQSDPARRRLSSNSKLGGVDESMFTLRTALGLLGAGTACALIVREVSAWKFKKRGGLPAKLREKVGSQPAADMRGRRGSKSERDTPSKSSKRKNGSTPERSSSVSSSDGGGSGGEKAPASADQGSAKQDAKYGRASGGGSKGGGSHNRSSPDQKQQPESPRTQQKREEKTRQKKEQRDKQKEKSRQESVRAEAEALSKAKAAAMNAARRSAAALAALEEVNAAEEEREAELLQQKQVEAEIVREAAEKVEIAARAEAKLLKAKLKKKERKLAAKLAANANAKHNASGTNAGAPHGSGSGNGAAGAGSKPPRHQHLPMGFKASSSSSAAVGASSKTGGSSGGGGFGPSIGLGVDWSSMGTLGNGGDGAGDSSRASGGGGTTSRLSSASLDDTGGSDDGDLGIDVFAVLQDEIMSRETQDGSNDNGGDGMDESRLLSNLIDFLDTDDSDSESLADSHSSYSDPSDFFGGGLGGLGGLGMNQLSANAPEFTPTFGGGAGEDGADGQGGGYDVASLSVEVWMDAHDLSQYTSNLIDAGLHTVGDMLESMPLTHDHLKSLGLTKLRGRLLLMNSLKTVLQGTGEAEQATE